MNGEGLLGKKVLPSSLFLPRGGGWRCSGELEKTSGVRTGSRGGSSGGFAVLTQESEMQVRSGTEYLGEYTLEVGCLGGIAGGLSRCAEVIFDGEDSAGADSGLLRGGTGGGTGASSEVLAKFMDDTEADLVWKGLEGSESKTLQASVVLEVAEAGGGVSGVRGEFGADAVASVSLSGMRL